MASSQPCLQSPPGLGTCRCWSHRWQRGRLPLLPRSAVGGRTKSTSAGRHNERLVRSCQAGAGGKPRAHHDQREQQAGLDQGRRVWLASGPAAARVTWHRARPRLPGSAAAPPGRDSASFVATPVSTSQPSDPWAGDVNDRDCRASPSQLRPRSLVTQTGPRHTDRQCSASHSRRRRSCALCAFVRFSDPRRTPSASQAWRGQCARVPATFPGGCGAPARACAPAQPSGMSRARPGAPRTSLVVSTCLRNPSCLQGHVGDGRGIGPHRQAAAPHAARCGPRGAAVAGRLAAAQLGAGAAPAHRHPAGEVAAGAGSPAWQLRMAAGRPGCQS